MCNDAEARRRKKSGHENGQEKVVVEYETAKGKTPPNNAEKGLVTPKISPFKAINKSNGKSGDGETEIAISPLYEETQPELYGEPKQDQIQNQTQDTAEAANEEVEEIEEVKETEEEVEEIEVEIELAENQLVEREYGSETEYDPEEAGVGQEKSQEGKNQTWPINQTGPG